MATITPTSMTGSGVRDVNVTTLTGADDFIYDGQDSILILHNPTAGALSPVIDGDGTSSVTIDGIGTFDLSAGYDVGSIAAGDTVAIPLLTIRRYLLGNIAVTSSSGLEAQLLEF